MRTSKTFVTNRKRNRTESVIGLATDADNTFRPSVAGVGETRWLALIGIPMPKALSWRSESESNTL
jgi:hypothetical protein